MRAGFRFFLILLPLSGCVQPRTPVPPVPSSPPPSRAAPVTPPAAPLASNWADRTPAPGVWTYARDDRGSIARFGVADRNADLTIRCETSRARIFVSRPGAAAARMTLRSTNGAKAYDARPVGGTTPYVAAELAASDPQLDSLAFSRGRILIGLDGTADLIAPIWPELTRVVEDCRK